MSATYRNAPVERGESESWAGRPDDNRVTDLPPFPSDRPRLWIDRPSGFTACQGRAFSGVSTLWWEAGRQAIEKLAGEGEPWSVDTLHALIGDVPADTQCAFGALLSWAARTGVIVVAGQTVNRHGSRVRTWVGGA